MNKPPRIDQFLAYFDEASLPTKFALALQNYFRSLGYYSEIFFAAKSKRSRTTSVHELSSYDNFFEAYGVAIYHHYQHNYIMDRLVSYPLYRVNLIYARVPSLKYSNFALQDEAESRLYKDTLQTERYLKKLEILGHRNWVLENGMIEFLNKLQWGKKLDVLREKNFSALEILGSGMLEPMQQDSNIDTDPFFKDEYLNLITEGEGLSFQQIHLVLMMIALLKRNCKTNSIRWIFIGKISKTYGTKLMAMCKELQLNVATSLQEKYAQKAACLFLSEVSEAERIKLYERSSIYMNLASYTEDPRPLFFARSRGVPILTWDSSQNLALLGENGVLFMPEGDIPRVVEALMAFIHQKDFRDSLQLSAKNHAKQLEQVRFSDTIHAPVTAMLDGFSSFRSAHL